MQNSSTRRESHEEFTAVSITSVLYYMGVGHKVSLQAVQYRNWLNDTDCGYYQDNSSSGYCRLFFSAEAKSLRPQD